MQAGEEPDRPPGRPLAFAEVHRVSRVMKTLRDIVVRSVKRLLLRCGYRMTRIDNVDVFENCLYFLLKRTGEFFFIQIGANDGIANDPIYHFVTANHHKIKGIVIEPMKDAFEQLQYNYRKHHNIRTVNRAIHNSEKEMILWRVDPAKMKQVPEWARGIASFSKEHHKLSNTPADCIIPEKVRCISLVELIKEHHVAKIDLLQIDTEGYDSEIILHIDFNVIKPRLIHFEHGLSAGIMSQEAFSKVLDVLHSRGYEVLMRHYDAVAYERRLFS